MTFSEAPADQVIEALKVLGLTKYESLVYLALMKYKWATATEIHEESGVPRASVYPTLDRLVERGLVNLSRSTPKRFNAIKPKEGLSTLMRDIGKCYAYASDELQKLYDRREDSHGMNIEEVIWSLSGKEKIVPRLENILKNAKSSVYILSCDGLISFILPHIDDVGEVPEFVLISETINPEIKSKILQRGDYYICKTLCFKKQSEFSNISECLVIVDNSKMLIISYNKEKDETNAIYSESPSLIAIIHRHTRFEMEEMAEKIE